ncbi:MAG: VOC family protein [Bacteroidota bacterium]
MNPMLANLNFIAFKLFSIAFFLCNTVVAQTYFSFDHQALIVKDLEESVNFYTEILGANKIEDPTGNPAIDWVEFMDGTQMHFIENQTFQLEPNKSIHFAFKTNNLENLMKELREKKIHFENWPGEKNISNTRPDDVLQIYLQDPNGYWIEVNDN